MRKRKRPNLIAIGKAVSAIIDDGVSPAEAIAGRFSPDLVDSAYVELAEWIDLSHDEPTMPGVAEACRKIVDALKEANQ